MKILIISLAGIGDTLLATPLIHELGANFPDAQIDALVLWAGSRDLLEGNPHLNTIFQHNFLKESRVSSLRFLWPLRGAHYDISINAHPQSRIHYRATARFIGAHRRISHIYDCSGFLDNLLVNETLRQDYQKHSVDLNLELLGLFKKSAALPKHSLEIFLSDAEHAWAEAFLKENNLQQQPRLGLHVGSGGTKNLALKRWPLAHYIKLLGKVRQSWPNLAILLFGGPEEEPDLQKILEEHKSPLVIRVRSQNLRQAAALMQRCSAFLSVDTALMHIAAAVKTPNQIVIEAPTFNKTNEPYGNPFVLVRNPALAGRNLEYYRYDGKGIHGSTEELIRIMGSVSPETVYETLAKISFGRPSSASAQ
ncbi:MAG TPA: glycosyltransferase family 9 protein [Candidatus Limnocylindrales bacterium]|nr:glycosyltransferase family 9 protein [Candidatus Limnocylindrales bacterium]